MDLHNSGLHQTATDVKEKNMEILVVVNRFLKIIHVVPFPKDPPAPGAAQLFYDHI